MLVMTIVAAAGRQLPGMNSRARRASPQMAARAAPAQHGLVHQMAVLTIVIAGAARRQAR
jgi:hypothetical protein